MKRRNRIIWLGAIALAAIILLSITVAPSSKINSGSSYNRAPEGYGAWYAFMQSQGTNIQRWQKPFSDIETETNPVTLLQVNSTLRNPMFYSQQIEWVKKGNALVILGVKQPPTAAEFSSNQKSAFGDVKIDTSRRYQKSQSEQELEQELEQVLLGDRYGAVVWEEKYGKGKVIFATTPHLAANAYQEEANFVYLADLVTKGNQKILIDEYIHGYKDPDIREKEGRGDLLGYLAKTPLFPALVQVVVLLLVLIWSENRRFGKPVTLDTPVIDNSQAYIQALAGILQKAESSDFVLEMVGKEEQLQLQKVLGLGQILVENEVLLKVWQDQTGKNAAELDAVLKLQVKKHRISEQDLISWLGKWQSLRKNHNSKSNI
ncbi:DUF4350 domain-containing protein [Sphaerospermopsis kisseleviana CS-549]|uniref:DUF4350 domain-containing protein n=1 Tax=Sphaerospermopsis kisseleviana CS-549 TaxID=3021783 RepID=A0ABT4ZK85_9CYAN|nr:DUF4350 domain-containing protein [Sphaerospermopsis kisseleviana]MDB9439799.1 DUF4350 domain-containing protein [Sphaerospermopsis kisseleviana CS-549]BAZ83034.1 hypothetical protein NIES73_43170 [Sphaerospermopsis kisseleviana NIES-73]